MDHPHCWHRRRFLTPPEESIVLLALPDVRQSTPYSCGDAAIACVLGYHRIVARSSLSTSIDGLDPQGIERHLRRVGLHVVSGSLDVADLGHFCDQGRPPIVLLTWPGGVDSHWCVVRGVSRARVYLHDPEDGPCSVRASDFVNAWHAVGKLSEQYRRWGIVGWPG